MVERDLEYGQKVIRRVLRKLEKPEELENDFARAVLEQAVRNAASRPTPQARMAAENMTAEGANIYPLAGGAPAAVAFGSEFGSFRYLQFQRPPNPRGYWLYPASESTQALLAADRSLEEILQKAVRGG